MFYKIKSKISDIKCKYQIIKANRTSDNAEIQEIIRYLKGNQLSYFDYSWFKPENQKFSVIYDEDYKGYFVIYERHHIYMKRGWDENRCKEYYSFLLCEQDKRSPHRYLDSEISQIEMDTVIDGGGAEGSFAISVLDHCKEIFILECDKEWVEALEWTFKEFKHKVHIISKLLEDVDSDTTITLNTICKGRKIDLVKMDIEGDELRACKGAVECIRYNPQIIFLICVYHYQEEENDIRCFFRNLKADAHKIDYRKGYIYFCHDINQKAPYLRRGVLKVTMESEID